MKINHSKIEDYNLKLSEPFEYYTAKLNSLPYSLITLSSDNGLFGYGEAALAWDVTGETQKGAKEIFKYFLPILKDRTIECLSDIKSVMEEINTNINFNSALKSAVEMALLDLLGKYKNKPVYKLFSNLKPITINSQEVFSYSEEEFLEIKGKLKKIADDETIIKIKVGNNFKDELKFISEIYKFNSKIRIVLDVNQGWEDARQALKNINQLQGFNILWIEQPIRQDAIVGLTQLVKKSKITIMADESCHNTVHLEALLANKAVDCINVKIAKSGGFFEALRMIDLCNKKNIKFMLGDMLYSDLGTAANLNLAQLAKFMSFDVTSPSRIKNSKFSGVINKDNKFNLSDNAGLGVSLK